MNNRVFEQRSSGAFDPILYHLSRLNVHGSDLGLDFEWVNKTLLRC